MQAVVRDEIRNSRFVSTRRFSFLPCSLFLRSLPLFFVCGGFLVLVLLFAQVSCAQPRSVSLKRTDSLKHTDSLKRTEGAGQVQMEQIHPRGSASSRRAVQSNRGTQVRQRTPQEEADLKKLLPHFKVVQKGSSSRENKKSAIKQVPFKVLSQRNRSVAERIVKKCSLYRKMPVIRFEISPEAYHYFIAHPDVTVSLWRAMEISKMQLWEKHPHQYKCDGRDGTLGTFTFLARGKQKNLLHSSGVFQSPYLLKPIQAEGLILLSSRFDKQKDGRIFVTHESDVFITFPSFAIASTARMISPLSNIIADRNFKEVSLFLHTMALAMEKQPAWVDATAQKMDGVQEKRKKELSQISRNAYAAAKQRRLQQVHAGVSKGISIRANNPTASRQQSSRNSKVRRVSYPK